MAGEWRKVTVAAFAPFAYGKGLPEHQRDSSGHVPVFGSNGVVGFHGEALTSGPTVVIGRKGTVGAVHYSPKPCWPIDTTFYVVDPDPCVLRFKYYLLKALGLEHMNADSAVPGLNRDAAHSREVLVPPLAEQRAIAHILGALDDKIELNRRMNATLEAMARALFKSWFVDFDPVRAKMEGRWRRGQSLPGLPAHLWDLFPDRLVDSELGEIPEGWETATLGELCEKPQYGYTASAAERPVGPHFLRITDINKQPWIEWSSVPYCDITEEEARKYLLRDGDVVIARMADPGHAALVEDTPRAVFASYLIRFRPLDPTYGRFLQYWLRSPLYWELVHGRKTGSTRATLNAQMLSDLPLTVPGKGVAAAFRTIIDAWRHKVVHNVHNSSTLAALRDALLPKLLSGEIDVSALDGLADPPAQAGEVP